MLASAIAILALSSSTPGHLPSIILNGQASVYWKIWSIVLLSPPLLSFVKYIVFPVGLNVIPLGWSLSAVKPVLTLILPSIWNTDVSKAFSSVIWVTPCGLWSTTNNLLPLELNFILPTFVVPKSSMLWCGIGIPAVLTRDIVVKS